MSVADSYPHRFQYWFQANKLLEDIATLPTPQEQQEVIQLALVLFDHHDTKEHDELVEAGAITILTRRLQRAAHGEREDQAQIDSLCLLLGMVLRCSSEFAEQAFKGIGTDLVSILFEILLQDSEEDCALAEAVNSVIPLLDRLSYLTVSLQEVEKSNQLVALLQYFLPNRREYSLKIRVETIKMLAGLTQHPDSKSYASQVAGLLDDVVDVATESALTKMHLYAAKILKHLSWEPRNKSFLLKTKGFFQVLLNLNSVGDLETRLEVSLTLLQLSTDKEAKNSIVNYDDGAALQALIESTKFPCLQPTAIETILYLVGRSTAQQMIGQEWLLPTVLSASMGPTPSATIAAQTLKRLATFIPVGDSSHPDLLDAVISISSSKIAQVRLWAAKALVEQSHMMATAFYIARDSNVMHTILQLARDSSASVRATAVAALFILANDQSNVKRIASNEDVLETLQHVAESNGKDEVSGIARRRAIQVLLTLANHRMAKDRVAKQLGVVAVLSKYAVSDDPDDELKHDALHGVIVLAPLM